VSGISSNVKLENKNLSSYNTLSFDKFNTLYKDKYNTTLDPNWLGCRICLYFFLYINDI